MTERLTAFDHGTMRYRRRSTAVLLWLLGGVMLLAAGPVSATERYGIVLAKSQLRFTAYSLLVNALGTFHRFSGDIIAEAHNVGVSQVRFVIDATSIDTNNEKRDTHLRSEDFLFVEHYPTITFVSTAITPDGSGYLVQGDLELHGVTKRITIPVTVEQQQHTIVVEGSVSLNRRDFGINYNAFFNPVKNNVDVTFTIVAGKP